jgi:hypothetical protein
MDSTPTAVYRYYDRHGVLIYVGVTSRGTTRNFEHVSHAEWWPHVASQEVEHHADRSTALAREKELIREFRPPFNRVHNVDHQTLRATYMAFADAGQDSAESFPQQYHRLKHRLTLVSAPAGKPGLTRWATVPDEHVVAKTLEMVGGSRVVLLPDRPCGQISAVDHRGMFVFITATVARDLPEIGHTYALLKTITLKPQPRTRIHTIRLEAA